MDTAVREETDMQMKRYQQSIDCSGENWCGSCCGRISFILIQLTHLIHSASRVAAQRCTLRHWMDTQTLLTCCCGRELMWTYELRMVTQRYCWLDAIDIRPCLTVLSAPQTPLYHCSPSLTR